MATTYETMQTAGRVYAEALLQICTERKVLDEVEPQIVEVMKLWHDQPSFAQLMSSAAIDADARRASLRKIFTGRVHEYVLNLLLVLNDKGRTLALPQVCDAFNRRLDAQRNRQRVRVTATVVLSDAQKEGVRRIARRICGREPVLIECTDPSLLGGMVVQIGDKVVDTSLKLRLRKLQRELRGRFDRHLNEAGEKFVSGA